MKQVVKVLRSAEGKMSGIIYQDGVTFEAWHRQRIVPTDKHGTPGNVTSHVGAYKSLYDAVAAFGSDYTAW
jgi:hypothetical protein